MIRFISPSTGIRHRTYVVRYMAAFIFFVHLAVCMSSDLAARDWPFETGRLADSFASANDDRFRRGLLFEGSGERVNAWAEGEVIWVSDPAGVYSTVSERGLVALEHEDGFRSIYKGIDVIPSLNGSTAAKRVSTGDTLGYAGDNGWSFEVNDTELSRLVDPLSLLPRREGVLPLPISGVELIGNGGSVALEDLTNLTSGRWTLVMAMNSDPSKYALPVEISLYWVGERISLLRFDSLVEKDGTVQLETPELKNYEDVFDNSKQLVVGEVLANAGRGILELRVIDETGRVSIRSWRLSVSGN